MSSSLFGSLQNMIISEQQNTTASLHSKKPSLKLKVSELLPSESTIDYHPPTEGCASPTNTSFLPRGTSVSSYNNINHPKSKSLKTSLFQDPQVSLRNDDDISAFSPIYADVKSRTLLDFIPSSRKYKSDSYTSSSCDEEIYSPQISTPVKVPLPIYYQNFSITHELFESDDLTINRKRSDSSASNFSVSSTASTTSGISLHSSSLHTSNIPPLCSSLNDYIGESVYSEDSLRQLLYKNT